MLKGIGDFVGIDRYKPTSHRYLDILVGAPLFIGGGYLLRKKKHILMGDALALVGVAGIAINVFQLLAEKARQPRVDVVIGEAEILPT